MNYEQLLYATELANHRTLQETAKYLHISKSGLSHDISQLEKELGVKIFKRSRQGTQLTSQGAAMMPYIKQMLSANMKLIQQAGRLSNPEYVSPTRIAYANTLLRPMINEFIEMYRTGHPLIMQADDSDNIIDRVRRETLDAGFIAIDERHQRQLLGLEFESVHHGHIKLITSPNNELQNLNRPLELDDLKYQRFALFNDPYNDQLFNHLELLCGPLEVITRLDDAWGMYEVITKLNATCLARDWQARHSTDQEFASLPTADLSNIIDNRFELGWVLNPHHKLTDFTKTLIANINKQLK